MNLGDLYLLRGSRVAANNLRVRCRAHNQLWAEDVYGREQVEETRHFRRKKREGRTITTPEASSGPAEREMLEKTRLALTAMGFPGFRARLAIAALATRHDENRTLEQTLREALALLTKAA